MPALPRSIRHRQYRVALESWEDNLPALVNTVLVSAAPPGPLEIVEQQFDYDTAAIDARYRRRSRPNESFYHQTDIQLIGQDRFYGDPGQAIQFPLSERLFRVRPGLYPQDWFWPPHDPGLLGQDRLYGDPGQVPSSDLTIPMHYHKRTRSDQAAVHSEQADSWQNPSNTTLAGQDRLYGDPGQVPSADLIIPSHYHKRRRSDHPSYHDALPDSWQNPLNTILQGQDILYGAPGEAQAIDWTQFGVPRGWINRIRDARPYLLSPSDEWHQLNLTGQDVFYGAQGQSPWPHLDIPHFSRERLLQVGEVGEWMNSLLSPPIGAIPPGLDGAQMQFDQDTAALIGYLARRYREHQNDPWTALTLQGTDTLYGDPGQAPVFEWSDPSAFLRHLRHRRFRPDQNDPWPPFYLIGQDSLPPGLGPPMFADDGFGVLPHYTFLRAIRVAQDMYAIDLLETTLAPAGVVTRHRFMLMHAGPQQPT